MRVFAISDLHLSINNPKPMDIFGAAWDNYIEKIIADWEARVEDEDIVLLGGDFSWAMDLKGALPDLEFIGALKGRKVLVRGNHDYWWKSISAIRAVLPKGMYAVQNDAIKIDNLVVFGTRGWTTVESNSTAEDIKIYNRETERLKLSVYALNKIREESDRVVCLTHFPPFNVRREDSPYTKIIESAQPNAVVYGHLHGKDCRKDIVLRRNGIRYYLTSCDLVGNSLVEIEL